MNAVKTPRREGRRDRLIWRSDPRERRGSRHVRRRIGWRRGDPDSSGRLRKALRQSDRAGRNHQFPRGHNGHRTVRATGLEERLSGLHLAVMGADGALAVGVARLVRAAAGSRRFRREQRKLHRLRRENARARRRDRAAPARPKRKSESSSLDHASARLLREGTSGQAKSGRATAAGLKR